MKRISIFLSIMIAGFLTACGQGGTDPAATDSPSELVSGSTSGMESSSEAMSESTSGMESSSEAMSESASGTELSSGDVMESFDTEYSSEFIIKSTSDIPNIIFSYGGRDYDMRDRVEAVNAITHCIPVGKHIVVVCHVNPKNGVYSIFNTETESFETDLIGCNLIWYDDDITTSVYSFWSEIYRYDGKKLANLTLSSSEWIDELYFTNDNSAVVAIISSFFDEDPRIEIVELQSE